MDILANLGLGFATAASPENLMYCFVGALLGTLIGVLPGIGPTATIALLLPVTFGLAPEGALIMLAGIYYGAQYGGSTTAILLNLPGESSSAVTALDGHAMARQGRAGAALAAAALSSFFAGTVATLAIALLAPPLTAVALSFGPPEYFALVVLGLVSSVALAQGSILKALAMILAGLLLGVVGTDLYSGSQRFTFDVPDLANGIEFVAVAVGMFGISEILRNLEDEHGRKASVAHVSSIVPSRQELKDMTLPAVRGTAIGSFLGILPGGGHILSSFVSYTLEKRMARDPRRFGRGEVAGVAGPEAANNAAAQTSFIPLLTLGIPANAVMAMMIGALILQGIQPGPNVMTERPALFWGVIASMWIGNLMLVLLNLPLIGLWVRLLKVPYKVLVPAILCFSAIGVYSINANVLDLAAISVFGIIGYGLMKLDCEPAPLLLGFILGPMLEEHLRRSMILSRGDPMVFLTHPISAVLLAVSALALTAVLLSPALTRKRDEIFQES